MPGIHPGGHRFDALPVTRNHLPFGVRPERLLPVGMAQEVGDSCNESVEALLDPWVHRHELHLTSTLVRLRDVVDEYFADHSMTQ